MPRRPKPLPEKLYGSTLSWEGWTFRVLSSARGVRWIDRTGTSFEELEHKLKARIHPDDEPNEPALSELREYLRGTRRTFAVPLDLRGTPFQLDVWHAVAETPYGETCSYGDIAEAIARARATRAVGQAVGANPVPLIIPCHRVVGTSGSLTGFSGGLPLKERLLALEHGSLRL